MMPGMMIVLGVSPLFGDIRYVEVPKQLAYWSSVRTVVSMESSDMASQGPSVTHFMASVGST